MVDFFGVGYLTGTEEKWVIRRLKCYGIEMERFWVKFKQNSFPLPYISRTYLVWEFLDSELSLKRVQWSIIFWSTYLYPIRHLVPLFHSSYLVTPIFSLPYDNHTPKWLTHPSHLLHIPLTCTYPFKHYTSHIGRLSSNLRETTPPYPYFMQIILKFLSIFEKEKKLLQKKNRKERGKEKGRRKRKKKRNRSSEKKENKLEEYLLFFHHHL